MHDAPATTKPAPKLRLFTFPPAWGLPTAGPFGIKLEVCLRMLGVSYERTYEGDASKGPKRKSPWIEDGAVRLADTELILAYLERTYGLALEADVDPVARARQHVLRRALEEHFHQVLEYELLLCDDGFAAFSDVMRPLLPPPLRSIVPLLVRRSFRKHLVERGIARHSSAEVAAFGRADVDALVALLGDSPWFSGAEPRKVDAIALGLLALMVKSPIRTPVFGYVREQASLVRFVERGLARFFPELSPAQAPEPRGAGVHEPAVG